MITWFRAIVRERGLVRFVFEVLLVVQLLHLGEHVAQMIQLFFLGWPPPVARGIVSNLDVEKVHFFWNLGVLATLVWLIGRGLRSPWLVATLVWAVLHTSEHAFLLTNALVNGVEGQPGILGAKGWLARHGWNVPGVTTWSRASVHFAWNTVEVALLALAYAQFAGWRRRRSQDRRLTSVMGRTLRGPAPVFLLLILVLLFSPRPASVQSGPTRYVNRTDATCGGHTPCYTTIQAAVNAVLPGETVVIQAGTYPEQIQIQGKNNVASANETSRIVITADPAAPLGGVTITGTVTGCTNGHAIRLQQSKYITLRGLTITGAGGQAIALLGGNNDNQAIHLERNRIFDNGSSECNGGITVNRGNAGTLIVNNLIYNNGRNGITFLDADGGPHYLVQNTIHANAWSGVSVARSHEVFLVNNAITGNGTATGSTGGRFGVSREASTSPQPAGIHLLNNLICGNRLGEIDGPALDGTDAGNLTPTGSEGPGVSASAGCQTTANVYAHLVGTDGIAGTADDDFTPASTSPVIDRGLDPRAQGFDPTFDSLFTADFIAVGVRPRPGSASGPAQFDIGAIEAAIPDSQGPTVTILQPAAGFVRQSITVQAQATDSGTGVATLGLNADGTPLVVTLAPTPPASSVTATATWNTTTVVDGAHTLSATATDRAGNPGTATRVVTVDNTPPDTQITIGPSGEIADTSATFTFTGTDNLTPTASLVFAWRLDGAAFSAFSSATSANVSGLAEGSHTFEVKARDLAGNEDPSPTTRTFTVNTGPRITSVSPTSGPVGTLVTLSGSGFVAGTTQVAFNGVAATVRTVSATTVTTTVPFDATTGFVTATTAQGTVTSPQPFTVTTTQDFAVQALPATAQVLQGTSTTYTVSLPTAGGTPFTGLATLTVTGLPAGVTASFAPAATVSGGQLRTLTLTATPGAAVGLTTLTITVSATIDGSTVTRATSAGLTVVAGGRTAALGQITFVSGTPIAGVHFTLGGVTTTSDAGGNFQLLDVPAGTQMLGIDANVAQAGLPIYAVDVTLAAGQATQLAPFRITPPPPPERFVPLANASADQVITDPRFPGASITIPAGVTITGWDGTTKTKIALERLSPDALPVPPPPGETRSLYQVFFGTPMGGLPSAVLPVTVPNDQNLEPGDKAEIWYYDAAPIPGAAAAWRLAGLGTVSADGSRVVSDPGVGISRFCGVCGVFCIIKNFFTQPNVNPQGWKGGEPVDLGTGLMVVDKTDLVVPGRLPARLGRSYNPYDAFGRIAGFELATGPGWTLSIDVVLLQESASVRRLILPGNSRFAFVQQANGTFMNTTYPDFAEAVLSLQGDGSHTLRFKDGTTWRFATGYIPRVGGGFVIGGLSLLVGQTDRTGNTVTITRDKFGAPTQVTEPGGRALTYTVDAVASGVARLVSVTDPIGRVVRYGYSATAPNRLETVTDPLGGVTRYTYTAAGGIVSIVDPRGITFVTNEYDANGRVIRQTQADGGVWSFAYMGPVSAHTSVAVTDPRGNVTTQRMDSGGFGSETVDTLGQVTRHERDAAGRLIVTTGPLGRVTRFTYDAVGNMTTMTDPAGQVRAFTYEPTFNRVTTITDPLNQVTRFEYDAAGNLTAAVDPLGNRTAFTYNSVGQPLTATDPLGNVTRFEYDPVGNLTAAIDPLGNRTIREYDTISRLARQLNALGQATTFGYDQLNRMETILDAVVGTTRFAYDPNGNLLTVTDARGNVTSHTYDTMDRVATRTDPVGAAESFAYDGLNSLTRHIDRKGQVATFSYDALNRRTGGNYADATTSFAYDGGGRLVQATDSAGGTVANQYDALDRLLAQTMSLGTISYQYDALGRRTTMTVPGQAPVSYAYDAASRLTAITQATQLVQFQYDLAGRRTRLTLPNQASTEYQYDAASRITALIYRNAAGVLGDLTYQYDPTGNRLAVGGSFARTLLPDPVTSATYDAANRQRTWNGLTLTYDANGNLVTDTTTTYGWDARDRLSTLSGSSTASFSYDPLGRRRDKTVSGAETSFQYDGLNPVQTLSGSGVTDMLNGPGIDEFFVATAAADQRTLVADALGSTIAELNPAAASLAEYTYGPFGQTSAIGTPRAQFQYTGRENDGAGLYYYRARYYRPGVARFVSEDPLGLAGGDVNRYAYGGNSPLNFRDPHGLFIDPISATTIATGIAIAALVALAAGGDQTPKCEQEPECSLASLHQLRSARIQDEHRFKTDWGAMPPSRFDICACKDGSIVIKARGGCGRRGPSIPTDARWR